MSDTLAVITEKDLIPEGTAYDPLTKQVFVSSTYKRKIVAIREDGTYYDFVKEAENDLWSTIGMEVDTVRKKLWVISAKSKYVLVSRIPTPPPEWQSKLLCYSLPSGTLEASYLLQPDSGKAFLNDLTVAHDGSVYATESVGNVVCVLPYGASEIKKFLSPVVGYTFLNGLTFSPDNSTLFVASTEGILAVDMKTRAYKLLRADSLIRTGACDGLAFYRNSLIGHQSKIITRFYLNERLDSIIRSEVLDDKQLNSSTTGEIGGEWYYYIANSQIRSGIDYSTMRIKPLDSLQNVIIKRKKL
ncbi:MAG: SMP-30/gluconolactonase/LRE family protein [Candidatus Kapabacteria bacterium]|nr:SMP-30/gluconolactonase/LRE family protein [Candidatus Kapabacteria bacterium]